MATNETPAPEELRAQAEQTLEELQAQAAAIRVEIDTLEAEAKAMDYTDPSAAVDRLAIIETGLTARRRALQAFTEKIADAKREADAAERQAREKQAAALRKQEDKAIKQAIEDMRALDKTLSELAEVRARLQGEFRLPWRSVIPQDLPREISGALQYMRGFHPELMGLPARPGREADILRSAEEAVKRAQDHLNALESTKGDWGGSKHEDRERARESLERAEDNLARSKGKKPGYLARQADKVRQRLTGQRQESAQAAADHQQAWRKRAEELREKAK